MSIRILDNATINKIAAGEVVERPAAVVKELIENSLDAGARRIDVKIDGDVIAVSDDGCGMSGADLHLAIERHATSKIAAVEDLTRLSSYGFRGEALPSIAAVSELTMRSRPHADPAGSYVKMLGGELVASGEAPMAPGTQVEVRRLFYNTPVRSRFLKAERTERGRTIVAVERLALGRPDVAFSCQVGGRLVLATPGGGDSRESLLAAYGLDVARDVRERHATDGLGRSVTALVGGPATARGDRRWQGVWVNARPVQAWGLLEAANNVYPAALLPGRRFPLLHLHCTLPPSEVDANVHPTKGEVRLAAATELISLVVAAVRSTLETTAYAETASAADQAPLQPSVRDARPQAPGPARSADRWRYQEGAPAGVSAVGAVGEERAAATWAAGTGILTELRPLGQSGLSWVVCDGPGGLYLIDQHAAHERVLYEGLAAAEEQAGAAPAGGVQMLAVPQPVDLSAAEYALWTEAQFELAGAGILTEEFGGRTVVVRGVPAALTRGGLDAAALLHDVLAALANEQTRHSALAPERQARRAVASCAAAVKANDRLTAAELQGLLTALAACREPLRCPHGRPTVVRIDHDELASRFGRR